MTSFANLVLYERHGHPAIGYRGETIETIDQIARGDVAEGAHPGVQSVSGVQAQAVLGQPLLGPRVLRGHGGLDEAKIRTYVRYQEGRERPIDQHHAA